MSLAPIFLILALLSAAGVGICHKVADFQRCKPSAINLALFFWASALMWAYALIYKTSHPGHTFFPPFTWKAILVAVACGTMASFGILTFQIGVRYGRITTSWLIVNLSTIVPAVLSLIVYQEWKNPIKWQQPVALALSFVSVVLLWRDKVIELEKGAQPIRQKELAPEAAPTNPQAKRGN